MSVRTGRSSSRHQVTSVRSPNVQHMAMPAPLSISAAGWASTGISTPKTGEVTVRAEERLVALVVGVRDQRDDAGDQLGTRGLDVDAAPVRAVERDAVVGAGVLAGLELGLRDGGLEGDVPERRRLVEVGLAAGEVAQEGALADRLGLRARWSCSAASSRPRGPSVRHSCSKTSSSCSTSRSQSSTKFGRLIGTCFFGSGFSGGVKSGS